MGGVAKKISEEVTRPFKKENNITPVSHLVPGMDEAIRKAGAKSEAGAAAEDTAARRRARRGGRALLSEARIAPETGLQQTLGTGV